MTLDIPGLVVPVASREAGPPAGPPVPAVPAAAWVSRHSRLAPLAAIGIVVAAFSRAWTGGALVLDGPGVALYVRLALDHLGADRALPYWVPDMWAGAPLWAAVPTFPLLVLGPLAAVLGPDVAVKGAILGFQVLGGWGAFLLARSLWGRTPASVLAGVLFALQPLVVSSGALAGSEPSVAVLAATPWLAWSLRRGLRGDGPGWVVLAGLVGGFAVLTQARLAVGLGLLGACLLAAELGRVATGHNPASAARILARAAAVPTVALGVAAYWLVPLASLGRSFVEAPPALLDAARALAGRDPGILLGRADELAGAVGPGRAEVLPVLFHLGWVCLALTVLSVVLLRGRHQDRDGGLSAVLLASTLGIWLSTGSVPLASGGPFSGARAAALGVAAAVAGLLIGRILRPMPVARVTPLIVLAVAFLVAAPYLTPFETIEKVTRWLGEIRFPQLHTVVPLGLALGAAYPVVLVHEWARRRRAELAPALAAAVSLAVLAVFVVDVWPSRTFYRVRPPATAADYRQISSTLEAATGNMRVSPGVVEPAAVGLLLRTGRQVTAGWPPSAAGEQAWRLTGEALAAPPLYRDRALGLASTGWLATERTVAPGTAEEAVDAVDLVQNQRALPVVRAYARAVVLGSRDVAPELAVGLAYRNVGVVVTGSPSPPSPALAAVTVGEVRSARPCLDGSGAELTAGLASQLGVACGLHTWLATLPTGRDLVGVEAGAGGVFRAAADRLQGVSVWLDRAPDRAELALYEVGDDGLALGPELARGKAVGIDEYGLAAFTFEPLAGSAGRQYAFVVTCPDCAAGATPQMVAGHAAEGAGSLLVGGSVRRDRAPAFSPVHDPVGAEPASTTTVRWSRPVPGRWRVEADGAEPSLLVVAEAWFPGWRATVDGRPAPVLEADGAFLGVALEPGPHVVTFEYRRPAAVAAGRLVTAGTVAVLGLLALLHRRSRRLRPVRLRAPRPPRPPGSAREPRGPRGPRRPPSPSGPAGGAEPTEPEWDRVVQPRRPTWP